MRARATKEFWACFNALPVDVQELARQAFAHWTENPRHPSLRFRPHGNGLWSARVGAHYRALARQDEGGFIWTWIGTHEEYNRF